MSNIEKFNHTIDKAYEDYCEDQQIIVRRKIYRIPIIYTKEEFFNKCKTNTTFSEMCRLKVEERKLSLEDRIGLAPADGFSWTEYTKANLDELNVPTKIITLTYNNETIENYE